MQRDDEVELFRQRFAGSQADRLARAEGETKKISQKLNETKIWSMLSYLFYEQVKLVTLCVKIVDYLFLSYGKITYYYINMVKQNVPHMAFDFI